MIPPPSPEAVDFLKIRHGPTVFDAFYQLVRGEWIPSDSNLLLKGYGTAHDNRYRLSDVAILEASAVAEAIYAYYKHVKKNPREYRSMFSFRSPQGRTSEFEEIIWRILQDLLGMTIDHATVEQKHERYFGNLQNLDLDRVVEATQIVGRFPNYREALTFETDFKDMERAAGVPIDGGETFVNTLLRAYEGTLKVISKAFTEERIPNYFCCPEIGHQIFGIFDAWAFELLNADPKKVRARIAKIQTLEQKQQFIRYFQIDPSRLRTVRVIHYNNRFWTEMLESNDRGHLVALHNRLQGTIRDAGRIIGPAQDEVKAVRAKLAPWYMREEITVDPYLKADPFKMHCGDGQITTQVRSPREFAQILTDKDQIPDENVSFHMIKNIHLPDWLRRPWGYHELADHVQLKNEELQRGAAKIVTIREDISKLMKHYMGI
jgi:hypothetical protein